MYVVNNATKFTSTKAISSSFFSIVFPWPRLVLRSLPPSLSLSLSLAFVSICFSILSPLLFARFHWLLLFRVSPLQFSSTTPFYLNNTHYASNLHSDCNLFTFPLFLAISLNRLSHFFFYFVRHFFAFFPSTFFCMRLLLCTLEFDVAHQKTIPITIKKNRRLDMQLGCMHLGFSIDCYHASFPHVLCMQQYVNLTFAIYAI